MFDRYFDRVVALFRSAEGSSRSLFGEILDWMLAPLLLLWPISMALEYYIAVSLANSAYDRELGARVAAISQQVTYRDGKVSVDLPAPAEALLRGSDGLTLFSVRGPDEALVAGDAKLPIVEFAPELEPGRVYFRRYEATDLRAAYVVAPVPDFAGSVLVQVAETDEKRTRLASEVMRRVLATQFVFVPLAVLLVWFGLSQGVRPLNEIQARLRRRRPHDLSPIETRGVPEELQPFVASINELIGRLDSSIRAQRRFVADAAHQMRTPLAGLKTQAELALAEERRSEVDHAIRQIATSADRATHMVKQLLALARAESDAPVAMKRVDLGALAREVTIDWVAPAIERGIDLGFELEPEGGGIDAWFDGNPFLVRELITNLVDNAICYTPSGGRVTVRVTAAVIVAKDAPASGARRGVRLIVEDSGIGIAEADRELVFERFYRAANAQEFGVGRGASARASGLGLAIVREIAQQHGATIVLCDPIPTRDADSSLPGTLVIVDFPSTLDE